MNEVTSPRYLLSFQLWHFRKRLLSGLHISASVCEVDRASLSPLPTQGVLGAHLCLLYMVDVLSPQEEGRPLEPDDYCPQKVHRLSPRFLFYFLLHSSMTVGSGSPRQLITWAIAALACELFCLALFFFLYKCISNWPFLASYPGEGNGTPLQYSCLENPMDGGAW